MRPKVIASTATIRRAGDQVQPLFLRDGRRSSRRPGSTSRDTFFALQRDRPSEDDARAAATSASAPPGAGSRRS